MLAQSHLARNPFGRAAFAFGLRTGVGHRTTRSGGRSGIAHGLRMNVIGGRLWFPFFAFWTAVRSSEPYIPVNTSS